MAGSDYLTALKDVLSEGGDSDTNACIVGGLIGACVGASQLPPAMCQRVLTCDTRKGKRPRPDFLSPRDLEALVTKLMAANKVGIAAAAATASASASSAASSTA
jgi:ADP-ribosyl-[dinitrogen reductase] hydrolase